MTTVTRSWPALFAWAAGLLHLALAAELAASWGLPAAAIVMISLMVLGAGELAWGIASLRAGRAVARPAVAAGALIGVGLAAAAIAMGCSVIAAAAAIALVVAASTLVSRSRRRPSRPARLWVSAVGMAVGALLVAGVLTPALSTTNGVSQDRNGPVDSYDPHGGH